MLEGAILSNLSAFSRTYILKTLSRLEYGSLQITMKDQGQETSRTFGTTSKDPTMPSAVVVINNSNAWTRMSINLDLGFAEAFMLGELECDDLVSLVFIYINNKKLVGAGNVLLQIIPRIQEWLFKQPNDSERALQNVAAHYDTSNSLFAAFLSPDMSYSCPIWELNRQDEPLEDAQKRKVHNIIDKACIRQEHHILDIGGGWAFLAIEAVRKTGCRVTVTTLSIEQKALGEQRVKDAGLEDRIEILLCDYRLTPKPNPRGFDRIVSVGMVEHVGEEYLETYFSEISRLLNPEDGVVVVQSITVNNQRYHKTRSKVQTFIDKYIFPGGYLPSARQLIDCLEIGSAGSLELECVQSIGPHYAKALRLWRENFLANWETIKASYLKERGSMSPLELEAFRRRWIHYFSSCEAGFRAGILGDHVITARRPQVLTEGGIVPL